MKIETIDINGSRISGKSVEIPEKIFSSKINKKLVSHVFYSLNANHKLRLAKTKQKNEIKGSTKKIYAQKGTGGARHASRKAPLFVGGGIAHGPKGGGNYKIRKLNKKEKKLSLISLFSQKNKSQNLLVTEDITKKIDKTKEFNKTLIKLKLKNTLFIFDDASKKNVELCSRNIPNIKVSLLEYINIHDVLKYQKIVFTTSSIKSIEKKYI